ncbi:MAG: HD domain-containing protein [Candidatus Omnitrophica bacterium]|nr:HD domain-containing protein [Candidatus Omnitrophota bacterium]
MGNITRILQKEADLELGRRIIPGSFVYLVPMAAVVFVTAIGRELPQFINFFVAVNLILCAARLFWGIFRRKLYNFNALLWKRICFTLVLSMAALWGFTCAATLLKYGITADTFIIIVATESISLGAFATLSTHLWLMLAFQILAMTPTAIAGLFIGTSYTYSLSVFIVVVQAFMFVQGKTYFNVYWQSITDNALLKSKQKELETAKQAVEEANQGLEIKINERTSMLCEKTRLLDESYSLTVETLITALDSREHDTGNHSLRVAYYTSHLTGVAGIQEKELEEIALGALLHDIGKIGIPDAILIKPGKLNDDEWAQMKRHPLIGWEMIKDIEFIGKGRDLVLSHQERFNGSGYPRGLKGKDIYEGARFFAIIDTFDALMSDRPYRRSMSFAESAEIIKNERGRLLDPDAVDLFLSIPAAEWTKFHEIATNNSFHTLIKQIRCSPPAVY